jgi:hypothetical protein
MFWSHPARDPGKKDNSRIRGLFMQSSAPIFPNFGFLRGALFPEFRLPVFPEFRVPLFLWYFFGYSSRSFISFDI